MCIFARGIRIDAITLRQVAARAGLDSRITEAIRTCDLPDFGEDDAAREIYEFARQILETGDVAYADYSAIVTRWGELGAVELTAVIGYYSMVAMTLNVHRIPLPDDLEASLPREKGLLSQMAPAGVPPVAGT